MKSKLFTPNLRTRYGTAVSSKAGGMFVNPPTHAEIPKFQGNAGPDCKPLSLKGNGSASTPTVGNRGWKQTKHIDY